MGMPLIVRWIANAKKNMSKKAVREPVTFEMVCGCGKRGEALRTDGPQIMQCKQCGDRLYVLPLNVYPEPPPTPKNRTPASEKARQAKDSAKQQPATQQPQSKTEELVATNTISMLETVTESRRKIFTPLRLIVGCILLFVVITATWAFYSNRRGHAEETYLLAHDAGMDALKKEDYLAAEQEFEKVANAVRILKRTDPQAVSSAHFYMELKAANHLSSSTLYDIISKLEADYDEKRPQDWSDEFRAAYSGQWFVIEGELETEQDISYSELMDRNDKESNKKHDTDRNRSGSRMVIHYPVLVHDIPLVFAVDLPVLKKYASSNKPRPLFLAVQINRCQLINDPTPVWVMDFKPETAFLWNNIETIPALGYPLETAEEQQRLANLLKQQTQQQEAE